jgi:hypothetical protein
MTTERKSLLARVLTGLLQSQVPREGMHMWEPSGALKFTTPKMPVRREVSETAPRSAATADCRLCA